MMPRLLIADDSMKKIQLLQEYLRIADWKGEALIVHTTEDAMQAMDSDPTIGFAFIDYYMPSANGPAVIAYIKQKNPHAHVALVSSGNSQKNFEEARQAGAEACICTSDRADDVERAIVGLIEEWKILEGSPSPGKENGRKERGGVR